VIPCGITNEPSSIAWHGLGCCGNAKKLGLQSDWEKGPRTATRKTVMGADFYLLCTGSAGGSVMLVDGWL